MSFPLNQRRPSTSDGQRRKPAWLPTHPPPRPKRPSTQRYSGHSRLVLSLLQLLFPSLFPLVTLTAVAANIPIRRRRVLKSREAPRRADKKSPNPLENPAIFSLPNPAIRAGGGGGGGPGRFVAWRRFASTPCPTRRQVRAGPPLGFRRR